MKISSRFLVLLLAALVLFNATGVFVLTYIGTGIHRMSTDAAKSEKKESLLLTVSEFQSLVWVGKKDFIWKGKVYDCISSESVNKMIRLVCAVDKKESKLRENLGSHFSPNDKNSPVRKSQRFLFKSLPAVPFSSAQAEIASFYSGISLFYSSVKGHFNSPELSRNTPPPEFC